MSVGIFGHTYRTCDCDAGLFNKMFAYTWILICKLIEFAPTCVCFPIYMWFSLTKWITQGRFAIRQAKMCVNI